MPPHLTSADGTRRFACFGAAILVFVVDARERLLLLARPRAPQRWEVVSGGIEAGETVLEAAQRELREEVGAQLVARPLGVVHAHAFHYDQAVGSLLSISYLMAYEGGAVEPADDMRGAAVRWASLDEIARGDVDVAVPSQAWMPERAIELYRLWHEREPIELEGLG